MFKLPFGIQCHILTYHIIITQINDLLKQAVGGEELIELSNLKTSVTIMILSVSARSRAMLAPALLTFRPDYNARLRRGWSRVITGPKGEKASRAGELIRFEK